LNRDKSTLQTGQGLPHLPAAVIAKQTPCRNPSQPSGRRLLASPPAAPTSAVGNPTQNSQCDDFVLFATIAVSGTSLILRHFLDWPALCFVSVSDHREAVPMAANTQRIVGLSHQTPYAEARQGNGFPIGSIATTGAGQ
jgi:hypothetical protein